MRATAPKRERDEEQRQNADGIDVLPLERVEEVAVPDVQPVLDEELEQNDEEQRSGQKPAQPQRRSPPETESGQPEAGKQAAALQLASPLRHGPNTVLTSALLVHAASAPTPDGPNPVNDSRARLRIRG